MIALQTTGRHFEMDSKIAAYVEKRLGSLEKYLPKAARDGAFGEVVLECDESQGSGRYVCEVLLEAKGEKFQAKEATVSMFAAVDICEAKLKQQILKYKSKSEPAKNRRQRLFAKMMGREPIESVE